MTSYRELRRKILSLLSKPPFRYNVPYLALLFHVDRTTIHHVIRPLVKRGIIHKEVYDGLTWISLRSHTLYETLKYDVEFYTRKIRRKGVDLIKNKRVSQTVLGNGCSNHHGVFTQLGDPQLLLCSRGFREPQRCIAARLSTTQRVVSKQRPGRANSRIKWPKRSHWARVQAFRILVRRRQLTIDDWVMLNKLFNAYLWDTFHRTIVLLDEHEGSTLWLSYRHRFTRDGIRRLIKRFNDVFSNANNYKYGVFITLTVDPKKYPNMIIARYELQKAWNRMMSYFKKRLGKRPVFIRIIEFTKKSGTGLIHYHVLLLGVKRLMAKDRYEARLPRPVLINNKYKSTIWASTLDELYNRIKKYGFKPEEAKIIDHGESLKKLLEKWGFGKIHDIKYVVNFNGRWMTYNFYKALSSTNDGGGIKGIKNLKGYLKKYLVKAFNDLDLESMKINSDEPVPLTLYWALNTRFFTYSKQLKPESETRVSTKIIVRDREIGYKFLGSGYIINPEILPFETDKPPWEYYIDTTFPPVYDPSLEV